MHNTGKGSLYIHKEMESEIKATRNENQITENRIRVIYSLTEFLVRPSIFSGSIQVVHREPSTVTDVSGWDGRRWRGSVCLSVSPYTG